MVDLDAIARLGYRVAHRARRAYFYVRRPETRGAQVAVWHDGRILLVRTSYSDRVGLPGGALKRGETPREAASRELAEEVGLVVPPSALAHVYHGTHVFEHRDDTVDVFEHRLESAPRLRIDGREVVWAGFRTPREALASPATPHLVDYLKDR